MSKKNISLIAGLLFVVSLCTVLTTFIAGASESGWLYTEDKWYYLNDLGEKQTGWKYINNKWFYFNAEGEMQTGWIKPVDKWYHLNADGIMETGWIKPGNYWYYLDYNGAMQTGWLKRGNNRYYLEENGVMITGWKRIDGDWYFFAKNGSMQIGWVRYKDRWYYLNADGKMAVGWVKYNDEWYYLDPEGAMKTGWVKDNDKWYFLEPSGRWNPDKRRYVVAIDPGHDATHGGASYYGSMEHILVLKIAEACRAELEKQGVEVVMTRCDNSCPLPGSTLKQCLDNRSTVAVNNGAQIMISFHINATANGGGGARGALAFIPDLDYNSDIGVKARDCANCILNSLAGVGLQTRGVVTKKSVKENSYTPYYNPDGSLADYYNICRESKWKGIPGVIIEHGFLDNYEDYVTFLNTDEKLIALGMADAAGIMAYLESLGE
ncbi:MAG: N-acetylmuramoyl-L-alanine amidase [Lachnospiraceae bacterium]|nr:N-acetylmuramoyl-L-alanine amidase [Lachnospiraceae bacterium]